MIGIVASIMTLSINEMKQSTLVNEELNCLFFIQLNQFYEERIAIFVDVVHICTSPKKLLCHLHVILL